MTDVPFVFFVVTSIYFFVLSEKTENQPLRSSERLVLWVSVDD